MERLIVLTCLLLFTLYCWGQETEQAGAKSRGLGHATVALADHWSLINNPGGVARTAGTALLAGFDQLYGIRGLDFYYAGATFSSGKWGTGLLVQRLGDQLFSNGKLGIVIGNRLGIGSLGLKANYHQIRAEGYDTQSAITLDFGGIVELGNKVLIGAEVRNITQSKLISESDEYLPVTLRSGVNYKPTSNTDILIEVEKSLETPLNLKCGLQYAPVEGLNVRGGFNSNPDNMFFGIGLDPGQFRIDYSLSHHTTLGLVHSVSLAFLTNKQ